MKNFNIILLLLVGAFVVLSGCDDATSVNSQQLETEVIDLREVSKLKFNSLTHNLGEDENFAIISASVEGDFPMEVLIESVGQGASAKPDVGSMHMLAPDSSLELHVYVDRDTFEAGEQTVQVIITGSGIRHNHKVMFQIPEWRPDVEVQPRSPIYIKGQHEFIEWVDVSNSTSEDPIVSTTMMDMAGNELQTITGQVRIITEPIAELSGAVNRLFKTRTASGKESLAMWAQTYILSMPEPVIIRDTTIINDTTVVVVTDTVFVDPDVDPRIYDMDLDMKVTGRPAPIGYDPDGDERYARLDFEGEVIEFYHRNHPELGCIVMDDTPESAHFKKIRKIEIYANNQLIFKRIEVLVERSGDRQRHEEFATKLNGSFTLTGSCPIFEDRNDIQLGWVTIYEYER